MRVLLIDVNCKNSSTGQIVYNLYSYLNTHGDEAAVCYGRGEAIREKNIFKFGLDWETNLHALLTRITGYTGCFSFFSTSRLLRFIDDFQPDVVHIHELHAYFVNDTQLLSYLAKKRIKVVHTLHCEFSYTGKCGHSLKCEKWKTECGACQRVKDYPTSLFFDRTKKMFRAKKRAFEEINDLFLVTPSEWLSNRARLSFFSGRGIATIHNGIDTNVFKPTDASALREKYGVEKDRKVVLALAPHLMSRSKGGRFVLELAAKLPDVTFVMIGIDGEIERMEGNTILLGPIYEKPVLAQFYSMADLFVICSERENYPTTCIEAQACGTPICGFDTGGTRETCITDTDDYFVPYGDLDALKEIILRAQKKPNQISLWLTENASSILSNDAMAESYREIYKKG